jgi:transposase
VRELPIRQRTQTINARRAEARLRRDGHLTEFGEVVPQGAASMRRRIARTEEPESDLPETARATLQIRVDGLRHLDERIADLDAEIARRAREDDLARRLMTTFANASRTHVRIYLDPA